MEHQRQKSSYLSVALLIILIASQVTGNIFSASFLLRSILIFRSQFSYQMSIGTVFFYISDVFGRIRIRYRGGSRRRSGSYYGGGGAGPSSGGGTGGLSVWYAVSNTFGIYNSLLFPLFVIYIYVCVWWWYSFDSTIPPRILTSDKYKLPI